MSEQVARLVAELDSDETSVAEEAQAALTALDPAEAGEALVAAIPGLGAFGRLCAIEVVQAWGYAAAGPALVPLLRDEDDTVQEWAAEALGELGCRAAVPELRAWHARLVAERRSPDWTGPVRARHALARLGAREVVTPPLLAATAERHGPVDGWPAARLEELVEALAAADQVVLYFQLWERSARGLSWRGHASLDWRYDFAKPWPDNVREAREAALVDATDLPGDREGIVAAIEWIDRADVTP